MDVTRILEADHRTVEDLFAKIEQAEGADRRPLIDDLARNLRAHMQLEEQTLYPAIASVVGKEQVEEGETEHKVARNILEDVLRLAPDDPGFGAAFEALEAGIAHHVEEEENDLFPQLRNDGARVLEEVATPFMTTRMELGMAMEAPALAAAFTKDELVGEAERAGVAVRSSMTKDDLAGALADVMA
jgi:hemerythrin-like domain-containing protein